MKPELRKLLFPGLGLLPLGATLPYLAASWKSSPTDQWNWIGLLIFLLLAGALSFRLEARREATTGGTVLAACLLALSVGGYALAWQYGIYMAIYAAGALIFMSLCGLVYGRRNVSAFLPCLGLLLFSATSIAFVFPEVQNPLFRWSWVAGLGIWGWVNCFSEKLLLRPHAGIFLAAAAGIWLGSTLVFDMVGTYAPCQPNDETARSAGYAVREVPPTAADRAFFQGAAMTRRVYSDAEGVVGVLTVKPERNIRSIHPSVHCLRSAGGRIIASDVVELEFSGQTYQVTETLVRDQDRTRLVWAWYSTPEYSVGGFIAFRLRWEPGTPWTAVQAAVFVEEGDLARGKAQLGRLFRALRSPHRAAGKPLPGPGLQR